MHAGCANRGQSAFAGKTGVSIITNNFPNSISAETGNAAGFWNASSCGDSGGAGFDFPILSTAPGQSATLTVNYSSGLASSKACSIGGVAAYCAAERAGGGSTITVYAHYGVDGTSVTPGLGPSPPQQEIDSLSNLLAHEFGHTLGLADDSCPGGIMNSNVPASPTIDSDECLKLDQANTVPGEADCQISKNCQCAPDDVVCQGSPIIVNVSSGDYRLTSLADPVLFDLNANGWREPTAWTARGAEMAFLWLDRNGDGRPNDGTELFGNYTPLPNGVTAGNGFEALAEFDSNGDGQIDAQDPIWSQLQLWTDRNHDGICQPAETVPIASSPVIAIGLNYEWTGRRDRWGNTFRYRSSMIFMGSHGAAIVRPIYDIYFTRVNQ